MNVDVTKRHDDQFPVGVVSRHGTEKFTLKAAKKLRLKLDEAIEWAVNMDDIRKESNETNEGRIAPKETINHAL